MGTIKSDLSSNSPAQTDKYNNDNKCIVYTIRIHDICSGCVVRDREPLANIFMIFSAS